MRDSGLVVAGQPLVAEDHVVALDYGQFSLCTATGIPDDLVGVVERALYLARPWTGRRTASGGLS